MIWSVCESRLSRSHTACEPQQSSAIWTGGCSGVTLLTRRTKIVTPIIRIIRIVIRIVSIMRVENLDLTKPFAFGSYSNLGEGFVRHKLH